MHSASDPDAAPPPVPDPNADARPVAEGAAPVDGADTPPPPEGRSRRWVLVGGAVVVLGGGAGVAAGFAQHVGRPTPKRPPAALSDALAAERRLLALASAAGTAHPALRAATAQLRRDHLAHARALQSELDRYDRPDSPASRSTSPSPATPPDQAALRTAEKQAASAAAARAATLSGATATLLASISACEATHAELLA